MRPLIAVTGFIEQVPLDCGVYPTLAVESHYTDYVENAGGIPALLATHVSVTEHVVDRFDGLLLTGGPDVDPSVYHHEREPQCGNSDPTRDAFELALVRGFVAAGKPVLAVCRGCQLVAAALGGTLRQHVEGHMLLDRPGEVIHEVEFVPGSRVSTAMGSLRAGVNSLHHQAVDDPGPSLMVTARASDGTVEAVEHVSAPLLAVQWHPEKMDDPHSAANLFGWLVRACEESMATR